MENRSALLPRLRQIGARAITTKDVRKQSRGVFVKLSRFSTNRKNVLAVCAAVLLFASAALAATKPAVADLSRFPQKASAYLPANPDTPIAGYDAQRVYAEEYLRHYYSPWFNDDIEYLDLSMDKVLEYHKNTAKKQYYTKEGKAFPKESMARIAQNGALPEAMTPRAAIALADADVRILPSTTPLFGSVASARGERGLLPLDVLQNSTVRPGEPLAVYAPSADAAWYFVSTGAVVGWVRSHKIALVDPDFMDRYIYAQKAVVIKDNVKIQDAKGTVATIKMGTVLPSEDGKVLIPVRGKTPLAEIAVYKLEERATAAFPVPFTPRNAARAVDQLIGEPYGWGGMHGWRDCSAMTRDYFSLFGIWLPRNSGDQARTGAAIPLKNIPVAERSKTILENAVPFATLIHMPGHIMLYLGLYDAEPVVLHNVWGVRTNMPGGKTGRTVIGKTVVSSLKAGEEIRDRPKSSLFIDNIAALAYPMANIR